jgi:hypothetical protein
MVWHTTKSSASIDALQPFLPERLARRDCNLFFGFAMAAVNHARRLFSHPECNLMSDETASW